MSYTNSTPNLHLPQYIATDKPTYLGDWNASMQTIDTVITATQATANGANSTATSANSTAQAAQQSANTANTKADNNATQIEQINNSLSFTSVNFNNVENSGITLNTNIFQYNDYFGKFYFNGGASKATNNVTSGSIELIAFASAIGNLFSLATSNITESDNHKTIGNIYITSRRDSAILNDNNPCLAYFDGANTVLYYTIDTGSFNANTPVSMQLYEVCTIKNN